MTSYDHRESQEMYLKVILKLLERDPFVRATDVCDETGYARSSVSRGLALLERDGYITRNRIRVISFTEKGLETAKFVQERYDVLVQLLLQTGLDVQEAETTACQMEHFIDPPVYEKLKAHLETSLRKDPS